MVSPRSFASGSGTLEAASPVFDPVWGTLGAPISDGSGREPEWDFPQAGGSVIDIELLGSDLDISGQIDMGKFDRLSGWLNMQSGFIPVRNAVDVRQGSDGASELDQRPGVLWVRLNQIVVVADRSTVQQVRPGAPIVQKERRPVLIVTHGYELSGSIHLHAGAAIAGFLEAVDPRFIAITELTVTWLASGLMERFPYAMVNREQVITVLDESQSPAGDLERREARSA
jgi:hypothetical protein